MLEPELFCMYTMPLDDIILRHGLQYTMYADDIHLYIAGDCNHFSIGAIQECVGEMRYWMRTSMLALNDSKTEEIHLSTKFCGQGPVSVILVLVVSLYLHLMLCVIFGS